MSFSIAGLGSCLPPRIVSNDEVASLVGLSASRIHELFDVEERRWARRAGTGDSAAAQSVADLASEAASLALRDAGLRPSDVDVLIAVSTTPECISSPLDYRIRRELGTADVLGFTLHAACTGLFRAATIVDSLFATDRAHVAVIVAADAISQYFAFGPDLPKDLRMSMALYGDGAGALVAVRRDVRLPSVDGVTIVCTGSPDEPGVFLAGPFAGRASAAGDDVRRVAYHDFRRVLEHGGRLTRVAADAVLANIGKSFDDVHHILTHQATGNLKKVAHSLGFPAAKLHVNIEKVGNTLSPSTLILFDELKRNRAFRPADVLLFCSAESATWSYGGMAVTWR